MPLPAMVDQRPVPTADTVFRAVAARPAKEIHVRALVARSPEFGELPQIFRSVADAEPCTHKSG